MEVISKPIIDITPQVAHLFVCRHGRRNNVCSMSDVGLHHASLCIVTLFSGLDMYGRKQ